MQEQGKSLDQPVSICERLYIFITAIFSGHREADCYTDSCSSHSEDSESEDEFWEAEDSTICEESNETSEDMVLSVGREELVKGKEKMMRETETNNRRELHLVEELGMYYGTPLSLVHERTNYRVSGKSHSQRGRVREASPEMMKRRHSMKAKMPKQRSEEVAVKCGKARMLSRVFTNINERSDAFIRSRREAMRKSYSVGSKLF